MSSLSHDTLTWLARRAAVLFAFAAGAIGAATLLGWAVGLSDVAWLRSIGMKPNGAAAALGLAAGLAAHVAPHGRRPPVARTAPPAGLAALALVVVTGLQWAAQV